MGFVARRWRGGGGRSFAAYEKELPESIWLWHCLIAFAIASLSEEGLENIKCGDCWRTRLAHFGVVVNMDTPGKKRGGPKAAATPGKNRKLRSRLPQVHRPDGLPTISIPRLRTLQWLFRKIQLSTPSWQVRVTQWRWPRPALQVLLLQLLLTVIVLARRPSSSAGPSSTPVDLTGNGAAPSGPCPQLWPAAPAAAGADSSFYDRVMAGLRELVSTAVSEAVAPISEKVVEEVGVSLIGEIAALDKKLDAQREHVQVQLRSTNLENEKMAEGQEQFRKDLKRLETAFNAAQLAVPL